jgi:hypothetical protein
MYITFVQTERRATFPFLNGDWSQIMQDTNTIRNVHMYVLYCTLARRFLYKLTNMAASFTNLYICTYKSKVPGEFV